MGFTAKPGSRWIRPDSGPDKSDFVVAKHFLFLHKHKNKVDKSQRFLVTGNCAPGGDERGNSQVLGRLLSDNNNTPIISRAIIGLADSPKGMWSKYVKTNQIMTKLWVTRHGVYQYIKEMLEERVSETEVFSGMQNLLEKTEPDVFQEVSWYEISIEALAEIANERGIAQTSIRNILLNKIKGKGQ